ncbi:MAG TPA: OmpA family protein [Polyangiaceae bacterium]|nr:OmpA family protein [Polyangiaceae bacterium]
MSLRSAYIVVLALAVPLVAGCRVSAAAGGSAEGEPAAPAPAPAPTPEPAPAAPAPEPEPAKSAAQVKGDSVQIPGNIVFDTGKATLKEGAGSEVVLDQLLLFLNENAQVTKLRVEGHTDNVGKPVDNEKLSGERALTIKKYLVDKGVPKERLLAVGFGQTKPVADNATEAGRAQNRRTEFKIAELGGRKYLGRDPTAGGKVFDL